MSKNEDVERIFSQIEKDHGKLDVLISNAGTRGGKAGVAYTMSKFALHGLVKNTAAMYGNDKMVATAEEITKNLLFLASDDASNINGQIIVSDAGLTNL